ncbi:MAG: class I SAM-dependent methyltransferase [Synechococcaceae cyanobacterium RL_1_2]|nr:class I SAM-dependent methyltransferase [Synechococcaceae cyanobacterium RL_1_2]
MPRILEPEVMDDAAEAIAYDAMDFLAVNTAFAELAWELLPTEVAQVLDLGTGTARIPILMAQQRPQWHITAIDLAVSMLAIAQQNIDQAGLGHWISLAFMDSKAVQFPDQSFDLVLSNSLIHHLPDPLPCLREIKRVLKPGGKILLRDLFRPRSKDKIEQMVAAIDPNFDAHQTQLFADSLHAAFTLEEVESLAQQANFDNYRVYQSSDRHWTLIST